MIQSQTPQLFYYSYPNAILNTCPNYSKQLFVALEVVKRRASHKEAMNQIIIKGSISITIYYRILSITLVVLMRDNRRNDLKAATQFKMIRILVYNWLQEVTRTTENKNMRTRNRASIQFQKSLKQLHFLKQNYIALTATPRNERNKRRGMVTKLQEYRISSYGSYSRV